MRNLCVIILCSLLFPLASLLSHADSQSEFDSWMKQETDDFQEYRDKRDKEFTTFLKSHWKEMQVFHGLIRDKTPKPPRIPIAPDKLFKKPGNIQPSLIHPILEREKPPSTLVLPKASVTPEHTISVSDKESFPLTTRNDKKLIIQFYGHKLTFYYDHKLLTSINSPFNENSISHYWSLLSKSNYESFLLQLNAHIKSLQLNDWTYSLLVNSIAQELHKGSKNNQAIFSWFILTKAGYRARIAYDHNYLYLLLPSKQILYSEPYFTFDEQRYYALSFDGVKQKPGKIFTYNGHYPGANRQLDLQHNSSFITQQEFKNRSLSFTFKQHEYSLNAHYDFQTIRYLNTLPQMDISFYFNSKVNMDTAKPLLNQLTSMTNSMSEQDTVNFLLKFVQSSFKYKTDEHQFGVENYLFPEEVLHYPYSDCEDRSVLFAWIVHNILGLDVIGLDYPGHISTAVKLTTSVEGDKIKYKNSDYIIADPTYINASVGMTMPEYKNLRPKLIRILN